MLFEERFWLPIKDGQVTLTFRRWKRRQAIAGRRYRLPTGFIRVVSVEIVDPDSVTDAEARNAGYESAADLIADLRGTAVTPVYRVGFRWDGTDDPRAKLARDSGLTNDDLERIRQRLQRMDASSVSGPWTMATLQLIGQRPGTRAADLATELGRERLAFKTDVRKLKNLGLTDSLAVGYELSARGVAFLSAESPPD